MGRSDQLQADRGNPRLKFLDRYLGIPLVAALSLPRRLRGPRRLPRRWSTIGLLLTSGIGDTVVATGALRDLRRSHPDARIILFVTANNASFARLLDEPDEVVELPVRRVWQAVRDVRAHECDVILDLGAWRRFDATLAILGGAKATVGLRTPGQHRHAGYDVVVEHGTAHEIENDRRLFEAIGVESTSEPFVACPAGAVPPVEMPYVVFHLWPGGANFEERSWPLDHWRDLASAMDARGYAVALTGGPGDVGVTQSIVERWRADDISALNATGDSWEESLAWLAFAGGVVSVNTGVMHVAAALGTPTIALNGPTSTTRWGPLGPATRSVTSPVVPDGYLNLGFERDARYRDCMAEISVRSVVDAWDELLAEVHGSH